MKKILETKNIEIEHKGVDWVKEFNDLKKNHIVRAFVGVTVTIFKTVKGRKNEKHKKSY